MSQSAVIFKGGKDGITVIADKQRTYEEVKESIKQKFESAGNFFSGESQISIHFKGRGYSESEKQQISEIIDSIVGIHATLNFEDQPAHPSNNNIFHGIHEGFTKFHRGTVRSGQLLSAKGNIVIIGDVNPGAEVTAQGNIVVMGSLRGIVHAGYTGNREAIVAALDFQPTQLRIADIISRSPDEIEERNNIVPEIAYVSDEKIYIDYYIPKKICE